jgi:hypothetical protein
MGWFQRLRTLGKRLLEWYEHARSILDLLGLDWRDIRDAVDLPRFRGVLSVWDQAI